MGPERAHQTKLISELRARGAWVVKYPAGPHGTIGTPDLLACYRGQFAAIEVKAGDPRLKAYQPTPMQQRQLDLVVTAGGFAYISWPGGPSANDMLDAIDNVMDASG